VTPSSFRMSILPTFSEKGLSAEIFVVVFFSVGALVFVRTFTIQCNPPFF
jgi:hypothetical protein